MNPSALLPSLKMLSLEHVERSLGSAGQSHVLQFWPELCEEERVRFLQELSQLDLKGLKDHCEGAARAAASPPDSLDQHIEPVPQELIGSARTSDRSSLAEWEDEGECFRGRRVRATTWSSLLTNAPLNVTCLQ